MRIMYVGKTINPKKRLGNHNNPNRKKADPKNKWLIQLKDDGLKPIYSVLEEVVTGDGSKEERFWIKKIISLGFNLLNSTKGGCGFTGVHSIYSKNKMSISRTGMKHSEESKDKRRQKNSYGKYEISRNGILLGVFDSSLLASCETGIDRRTINYLAKKGSEGIYFNAKGVKVNIIKKAS